MFVAFSEGFDYLLRLSTISVAFVGRSAIVVTLRRAPGAELGALHMHFVRFRCTSRSCSAVDAAFVTSVAAVVALWVNTIGIHLQSSAVAYALALTWLLAVGGWVFVDNLELFFGCSAATSVSPQGEAPADVHDPAGGHAA